MVRKKQPKERSKRAFGPLTPSSERPLVLPGGRRWYRPKDAYNDEFIAETLSAQAELITGSTLGWVESQLPAPSPTWQADLCLPPPSPLLPPLFACLCQLQLTLLKPYCAPYCHGHSHSHSHHRRLIVIVIVTSHAHFSFSMARLQQQQLQR